VSIWNIQIDISELHENYRHENLELDIYLPKECLSFEYQGKHHYVDVYGLGSDWDTKQKDKQKQEACNAIGITLIEIPYWWDLQLTSLVATLNERIPDFVKHKGNGALIPTEPPGGYPASE
jgi:hypothetical protein